MFAKLLQLAADKKLIVGMCVHPPGASGYCVEIWTGPSLGERNESYGRFPRSMPHMEALERVAELAQYKLVPPRPREASSRAFFQTTLQRDRSEPEVSSAAAGPGGQRSDSIIHHRESVRPLATAQ